MKKAYLSCSFQAHSGFREGVKDALSLHSYDISSYTKDCNQESLIEQAELFVAITPPYRVAQKSLLSRFSLTEQNISEERLHVGMGIFKEFTIALQALKKDKSHFGIVVVPFLEIVGSTIKRVTVIAYNSKLIGIQEYKKTNYSHIDFNDVGHLSFSKKDNQNFGVISKMSAPIPSQSNAEILNTVFSTLTCAVIQDAIKFQFIFKAKMEAFRARKDSKLSQKPITPSEAYPINYQGFILSDVFKSILNKYQY